MAMASTKSSFGNFPKADLPTQTLLLSAWRLLPLSATLDARGGPGAEPHRPSPAGDARGGAPPSLEDGGRRGGGAAAPRGGGGGRERQRAAGAGAGDPAAAGDGARGEYTAVAPGGEGAEN